MTITTTTVAREIFYLVLNDPGSGKYASKKFNITITCVTTNCDCTTEDIAPLSSAATKTYYVTKAAASNIETLIKQNEVDAMFGSPTKFYCTITSWFIANTLTSSELTTGTIFERLRWGTRAPSTDTLGV
jgi:hypothetical protein